MLKYFWSGTPGSFYGWLTVFLLVSAVLGHFAQTDYRSYRVEFALETEQPVNFDIYYDIGRGFNEVDHQSMKVETVDEPVTLSFCIPVWSQLEKLRFDPGKEHVKMKIYSITLFYGQDTVFEVPLETLDPWQHIQEHDYDGTRYAFETTVDGDDPIFELTTIGSPPSGSMWEKIIQYITWMFAGAFSLLLGGFIYRYCFRGI